MQISQLQYRPNGVAETCVSYVRSTDDVATATISGQPAQQSAVRKQWPSSRGHFLSRRIPHYLSGRGLRNRGDNDGRSEHLRMRIIPYKATGAQRRHRAQRHFNCKCQNKHVLFGSQVG